MLAAPLLLALTAAPAVPARTPAETVRRLYAQYENPKGNTSRRGLLSKAATRAYDAALKREAKHDYSGVLPAFQGDLVVQGPDYQITSVTVTAEKIDGQRCEVVASFSNFGDPYSVRFKLVLEGGLWRIDDYGKDGTDESWRQLLTMSLAVKE